MPQSMSQRKTADFVLRLYDTSRIVIPQARVRVLQKDEDFNRLVRSGGSEWEIYLHPSQSYLVELPSSSRSAVVGSAGTGKTICSWHRTKHLIDTSVSVGFVCPHRLVLDISRQQLLGMVGDGCDDSYFFVPQTSDELLQLANAVEHVVIEEAARDTCVHGLSSWPIKYVTRSASPSSTTSTS